MMNINIKKDILSTKGLSLGFLSIFILGFFTGEYYQPSSTIGLIGFLIVSIISRIKNKVKFTNFNTSTFYAFTLLFTLYFFGVFSTDTENWSYFWHRVTLKLPFILFPLGFLLQSKFTKTDVIFLLNIFLSLMLLTELGSLIYYATHYEEVNQLYLQSKVMPVVANHVRYSLMACFATFISFYLYKTERKKLYLFISIFFFLFQHLFAVRSGLFILYIVSGGYGLYLLRSKTLQQKTTYTLLTIVFLTIAIFSIPPLHNKVINTIEDLKHADDTKQASNYSLVGRQYSYKVGLELFYESPITGIGVGNIDTEVTKLYHRDYPEINKILMPHNQFIRILTESGLAGLLIFLCTFYFPLFYNKQYKNSTLLVIQYILVTLSFLFEGTLETQLGFNFSMFFIFLFLSHQGTLHSNAATS